MVWNAIGSTTPRATNNAARIIRLVLLKKTPPPKINQAQPSARANRRAFMTGHPKRISPKNDDLMISAPSWRLRWRLLPLQSISHYSEFAGARQEKFSFILKTTILISLDYYNFTFFISWGLKMIIISGSCLLRQYDIILMISVSFSNTFHTHFLRCLYIIDFGFYVVFL